ncbi:MAG: Lrp/AsnC family transcriptional regulator [Anaerolineae bacterium]|nr:Lrp/AsnC family transcriptional regulator [Anaerolineae bacterium]
MDELDRLILQTLQVDGRTPFTEIAEKIGVSDTTIRARYRALVEEGVVRTVGIVDPYALDFQAPAIIAISVEPGLIDVVARQIVEIPEVSYLVMTLGSYDLIVEVFCRNLAHLSSVLKECIHEIDGVRSTETLMISQSYKLAYRWTPPSNVGSEHCR